MIDQLLSSQNYSLSSFYLPLPLPLMLRSARCCSLSLSSLSPLLSGPYLSLSFILHFSLLPLSLCLLCCLIEGELRGGCSWRGPPCLVITSLFITRANGPRGEGNNNKLIEYELQLNRNLQHFILDRPAALADETALWLISARGFEAAVCGFGLPPPARCRVLLGR